MAVSITDQFEILLTIPRRTVYVLPVLDYYITQLPARLLENGGRYQVQYLIPMNLPRLTPDTVDVIFDTCKTDFLVIVLSDIRILITPLVSFGHCVV